jgi:hypothetical protein
MLANTSQPLAPWFVVPADDKWFTRVIIANIIVSELGRLDLAYPKLTDQQKKELEESKKILTGEIEVPVNAHD